MHEHVVCGCRFLGTHVSKPFLLSASVVTVLITVVSVVHAALLQLLAAARTRFSHAQGQRGAGAWCLLVFIPKRISAGFGSFPKMVS